MLAALRRWSETLKRDVRAILGAARDPRTPWYVKALALAIAAYALSPIDLIPDFIPVLGLLDDLVIVPLGIALALRWIPADVIAEHRTREASSTSATGLAGAAAIMAIWLGAVALTAWLAWPSLLPEAGATDRRQVARTPSVGYTNPHEHPCRYHWRAGRVLRGHLPRARGDRPQS